MTELNLQADTPELQRIKAYLQENASETLREKINNGTPFTKDGKKLINRKDLKGFMKYASEEARKLAEKNAQYTCVEDATVFGWAIHYFEESSIEGTLYNEDGSEYKSQKAKAAPKINATAPQKPEKPQNTQGSLFELLQAEQETRQVTGKPIDLEGDTVEVEPTESKFKPLKAPEPIIKPQGSPLFQKYKALKERYPDSVVALRLGDFYEVFGKSAVAIAEELDLTLTSRDMGLSQRVPMVGFPCHAAEMYFNKIYKTHSVVAVDNSDEILQIPLKSEKPFQTVDLDTDEILSEEEMREFDGDISEPRKLTQESDSVYEQERKIARAFDKETLIKLYKILGDVFIVR